MSPPHPLLPAGSRPTPHSGYHWDGSGDRFFEGWYYRVTLPQFGCGFAFMYAIDSPAGGGPHSGGTVQVLGPGDGYLWRSFPNVRRFWAARPHLELGHWGKTSLAIAPQLLPPTTFEREIAQGYQATASLNQGTIRDPASQNGCRWYYEIQPLSGWGDRRRPPQATAGWLSYLPVFEPGWQVLQAHALATGWIDWNGQRYPFQDAPAYSEKNWGRSFPQQWFWIQANSFLGQPDLSLTAVGAKRQVLGFRESVGLIGIHHRGQFYPFLSTASPLHWQVAPWGRWQVQATNPEFSVEIEGTAPGKGNWVRVATPEGWQFSCRDTMAGQLTLTLRDRRGRTRLAAVTSLAALEVGGTPWEEPWNFSSPKA